MSYDKEEIQLWVPIFASATSWIGQYFLVTQYPSLASEQSLDEITAIIDSYRAMSNFALVSLLESRRTVLEECIEHRPEEVFRPHILPQHEFELSILVSLQVYLQASLWEINMNQLARGPELLSPVASAQLEEAQKKVGNNRVVMEMIELHRQLLEQSREMGFNFTFGPVITRRGNEKKYAVADVIEAYKPLGTKYRQLKKKYIATYGPSSHSAMIEKIKASPTLELTHLTSESIELFVELLSAPTVDGIGNILSRHPYLYNENTISDLTAVESGDIRGFLSVFHSVEIIRILTLVRRIGLEQAIPQLRTTYNKLQDSN